jgi:hypothetical protein
MADTLLADKAWAEAVAGARQTILEYLGEIRDPEVRAEVARVELAILSHDIARLRATAGAELKARWGATEAARRLRNRDGAPMSRENLYQLLRRAGKETNG